MLILSNFYVQTTIKLLLGFILSGIIGAERESLNKPAGFKTHSLIGISAVLIMICGEYLSNKFNVDASRIPAQLLSGIGFIGAGTILTDGFNVKGLTTAASLLAVTCIGLSIGAGFYIGGIVCTIIVYTILSYSNNLFPKLKHYTNVELHIKINEMNNVMEHIEKIFKKHKLNIKKIKNISSENELQILCNYKGIVDLNKVIAEISLLDDILQIEEV